MPRLTKPKQGGSRQRHRVYRKDLSCYFCMHGIDDIDYKNDVPLRRFMSSYSKILPTRKTGICAKHQRRLAEAIKRSRFMAIVPYVS